MSDERGRDGRAVLLWGHYGLWTDGAFIMNGNTPQQLVLLPEAGADDARLGELRDGAAVSVVGRIVARPGLPTALEYRRLASHGEIAARAERYHREGRHGSAEADWIAAERDVLLGIGDRRSSSRLG